MKPITLNENPIKTKGTQNQLSIKTSRPTKYHKQNTKERTP
jgi:hypothetical protein